MHPNGMSFACVGDTRHTHSLASPQKSGNVSGAAAQDPPLTGIEMVLFGVVAVLVAIAWVWVNSTKGVA